MNHGDIIEVVWIEGWKPELLRAYLWKGIYYGATKAQFKNGIVPVRKALDKAHSVSVIRE